MCEMCKKLDFAIESLELLTPWEEWQKLLVKLYMESDEPDDLETAKIIQEDLRNVQMNIIIMLCVRHLRKKDIPAFSALGCFSMSLRHEVHHGNAHDEATTPDTSFDS